MRFARVGLVATMAVISFGAHSMQPDSAQTASQMLLNLYKNTNDGIEFGDVNALTRIQQFEINCSDYRYDDRYVSLDTLLRVSLLEVRGVARSAYFIVRDSPKELTVDMVSPPNRVHPDALSTRILTMDNAGRFLLSPFGVNGVANACEGRLGHIYETAEQRAQDPPQSERSRF